MSERGSIDRRGFITRLGAASVFPAIVSAGALKRAGAAPSERIRMGFIGTGGRGQGLLDGFMRAADVQVIAVCDVDAGHLNSAKQKVEAYYAEQQNSSFRGCVATGDFREIAARDDLDAVCIATPDHWHALASIACLDAGMDVYCEKPLANTVAEGRAICEAVKRNQAVFQTGSHERSTESIRRACELVRNGKLGELRRIEINLPCSDGHHNDARNLKEIPAPEPVPDGLDWDMWLGHTAAVPYTPRRCHFWWRFVLAYGGGEMTDRGAHVIDIGQLGAGRDETGPVYFEAKGVQTPGSLYDAWWDYDFNLVYADGVPLVGRGVDPRGLKFVGREGSIFIHIHGGALEAEPANLLEATIGDNDVHLGRSPGHQRNFLDCVKSREACMAPAEAGHRTATICHVSNIAMKLGRPLVWDPVAEQVINDDEANALLAPPMRPPWHL